MTTLPRDSDNTPIPALRLNPNGAHQLSAGLISMRNTTAFDENTRVVSVYATNDIYIKFGDKTVQTQYLSVLTASSDCDVYISEKQ